MDYLTEVVEDTGRTLVSGLEERFTPIWEAVQGFNDKDEYTQAALENHLEKEVSRGLGFTGYFGLSSILKEPHCYFRKEKGYFEIFFDKHQLTRWHESSMGPSVDVRLVVDILRNGKLLSDLTIDMPKGYIRDLFEVYKILDNSLKTEPTEIVYVGGKTSPTTRIVPVTKGAHALKMLKRAAELYTQSRPCLKLIEFPTGEDDDRVLKAKQEIYGLDLLKILDINIHPESK